MNLIPGKFYLPDRKRIIASKGFTSVTGGPVQMSVLLYHSIVEKRDVPLHYYCLFVDSDKPPIFFLGWSQLGVAQVKPLGPRYYENHPNPKFVTNIKAAKFLHENRFVWVLEEATKSLGEVNNEKEIASLRQS